ncbi:MAG TPA: M4 family metallopeptidase, partial [Bacteroidales bacterium]|nr:M4 family metallopeptidase [Bacteroidales bacterium]
TNISLDELNEWMKNVLKIIPELNYKIISTEVELNNNKHYRCLQTYKNIPIFDANFIIHTSNNIINSINGTLYKSINVNIDKPYINEQTALKLATENTGAKVFKWELEDEERVLKEHTENPYATYYPKGELFYVNVNNIYKLSWRFDIYAADTLLREWIFVDANTGEIILKLNRIHNTDTPGIAVTKYSGTQNILTDSYSGYYRLREAGRGNGIRTYNMQQGTNYSNAVDFTDTDNYWNNFNAQMDEVATDAHWAAEKYYDYLLYKYNRNSLDNAGFALLSYVHYSTSYANAFWDGQRMTYGDGDASWSPLTATDIAGHEMTHGLTTYTADLIYQNESGALNEAFSDIFGTALEFYAKPSTANWLIGEDIGSPIRSLSNPKNYSLPNTYQGQYWYTGTGDNGGVHTNCGVMAYWFYLVSHGGSGTNDKNNTYNVTGIGIDKAEQIAFRTLTIYLTNASQYADAKFYSIQATVDLYGNCSPEVETVTNAWYAVGIGNPYSPNVIADFNADAKIFCQAPAIVQFTNLSTNANSYKWYFGDGNTSTLKDPIHTYTNYGTFDVKLVGYGGSCGNDSTIKYSFISVDPQNPCSFSMPTSGTSSLTNCYGILYDNGGTGNYPDNTTSITTITPPGAASLTLDFKMFDVEPGSNTTCDYDYLEIYNGPSTSSPLIGRFCNTTGSPGIINTNGAATLKFYSDQALNLKGFEMHWSCSMPNASPQPNFIADKEMTCTGIVNFYDLSTNLPNQWKWDFGDGNVSYQQNPTHTYTSNGTYSVKLIVSNTYGTDSIIKTNYITVNMLNPPTVINGFVCDSGYVTLQASAPSGNIYWYDQPINGNIISLGSNYTTPFLNTTTTYYAGLSDTVNHIYYGGKPDNSGGGDTYTLNYIHYLIFDCNKPVLLKSVKVYSSTSGNRTIYLRNSSGNTIQSITVNIPAGPSRINLNFNVPAQNNLQLAAQTYPYLYRNNGGTSYPYDIGNIITITGSSATSNPTGYYYYFYDWEIIETDTCFSPRVPAKATVISLEPKILPEGPLYICPGDSIQLVATHNSIASEYLWNPTNDTSSNIYINTIGSYYFNIIDENGCSATSDTVYVYADSIKPVANFYYNINGGNVFFYNTSTNAYYFWDFGDNITSNIANPVHTYTSNGTYIVTLIAYNGCGADTITDTIYYYVTKTSSNIDNKSIINIFPNPASNTCYVNIYSATSEKIKISLYNVLGEKLINNTYIANQGHNIYSLDLKNINYGILLIDIETQNNRLIKRIIHIN